MTRRPFTMVFLMARSDPRATSPARLDKLRAKMKAEIKQVAPVEKAISPTLKFNIELTLTPAKEIPTWAAGSLLYPSDVLLAPIFEFPDESNYPEIYLRSVPRPGLAYDPTTVWLYVGARLGQRELDHIESVRARDPKGDVHLSLKLSLRTIVVTGAAWPLTEGNGHAIVSAAPGTDAKNVLSEDLARGFLQQKNTDFNLVHRIHGTDWVHDFAPQLGLGRFAVFEIPEPSLFRGELGERMGSALRAADKAEASLRSGDWTEVCEDLRGVWESLRDYPFVHEALIKDGFSEEAATLLNTALRAFFDLASKFAHTIDRDRKSVLPELTAKKEDAYLVYTSARTVLNLIARKAHRASR